MKKKNRKTLNVITGIAFIALLLFASGVDHATTATYVGMGISGAWLLFAWWIGGTHGNNIKK